ncbi:MAG: SDR family oxidoreductase [Deltaproteobacteria bacterium]|nr:SDR family oxidoreductase [Deltaproteobacteria bacterium]
MLLSNRVTLISGGATGMGRSIAVKFAREGSDIAILDINMKESNETLQQVLENGRECLVLECDVSDSVGVHENVSRVIHRFGKVDILVNNAGGTSSALMPPGYSPGQPGIENISEEEWDRVLAVNLKGVFLLCRECVPHMKEKGYGRIINISSLGWLDPPGPSPHYHAAKAGIVGLTNDLVCQLAPHNITVNAILPGPVRTPFYDGILASKTDEEKDEFFDKLGKTVPLQRVGTPEDIAGVALFLASELSSFVAGASIPVGGGIPFKPNSLSAMRR